MAHHHVFVYGTLKRGLYNTGKMSDPENGFSEFVGVANTVEKWPLVVATKWNVPFLLDKPGFGQQVIGEVYKVDDKMLLFLIKLERLYRRETIKVHIVETNCAAATEEDQTEELECKSFLFDNYKDELLDLPYDELYDPNGNPRHAFNTEKVPINEETIPVIKEYIERETLKDWDKQMARDNILKAKTSV